MLKAKKLFLSIMVVSIFVIGIFSLTSCNKGDDSGKIIDKENFSTIKNDYQLYKESKPQVMPEGEDIVIDGANYDINGVTTDSAGNVTSIIEIDVSKDKLNPTNGTQELKKLVECFVDIDQSGYSQNDYQYIYDCIFDGHSSIQITNGTKKATLDKIVENSKNLISNRISSTDKVLIHKSSGKVTWKVNIEKAGFYNLYLNYFTVSGYSSSIERKLMINGEIPFEGADSFTFSRVWKDDPQSYDENGALKVDTNGNDIKPQQIEVFTFKEGYFKDDMGYVTEPYMFYFEEGENEISLISIKEPILIDQLHIQSVSQTPTYEEYLAALKEKYGEPSLNNQTTGAMQAEKTAYKSSPTLYPLTDRSSSNTKPFSLKETRKNYIGGEQWKILGDWISWDFSVPEDGYYNISMRARQNLIRGMYSSRIAYISEDGGTNQVLFDELNDVQFNFSSDWQNVTLGNGEEDYLFYFQKGKTYTLTLEVTLGAYAPLIERIQSTIDDLNRTYRMIVSYTTTSPDKNRDYELTSKFPELISDLTKYHDELADVSNSIAEISGGKSDKTGVIDSMVRQLSDFIEKPRSITQKLTSFMNNISSLGSLLTELRELPLSLDYIEVHTPDIELPKANEGFFRKMWNGICSFFLSFFIDYTTIGETVENEGQSESIEVWMTLGRDQANVVRNLIDTTFTKETGIKVDLKLTGADVLLKATLAGIGPDVALNVDSSLPVNYALRNAVYDLTNFDDFWDVVYVMPDGATTWDNSKENVFHASSLRQFQFYSITNTDIEKAAAGDKDAQDKINAYYAIQDYVDQNNITKEDLFDSSRYSKAELQKNIKGVYALPEKQIFMVMFVRDDIFEENGWNDFIPETWDDVIDLVAELQTQQLQFYLPVNDAGANALNPVFVSMLYQNGGDLYANDNKETGLMSDAAMRSFEYWTEFYTLYSFPKSASFVNRFRSGEMPIGIAYYETYNTLSVSAPELKGKWSFHLIPGTYNDETGEIDYTSTASGTGAVIMKQPDKVSEKEKEAKYNASWEFLKWWTGAETQAQFGREMEGILGSAARHTTANVKAFQSLAWPQEDLDTLMLQWSKVHEMPQVAGSYIVGREIENAYREVINNYYNARETLVEYCGNINDEINRKRKEFDLPTLDD